MIVLYERDVILTDFRSLKQIEPLTVVRLHFVVRLDVKRSFLKTRKYNNKDRKYVLKSFEASVEIEISFTR